MTKEETKERVLKLRKEINRHRYLYHVLDRQEISDATLDSLNHELTKLEEQYPELKTPDSPSIRIAGKPLKGFKKVRHSMPMLSLNDAFSEKELIEWETRIKKLTSSRFEYFAETKIDGFAISLTYENRLLKTASTRGDGKLGEEVTENIKTIESIPLKLGDMEALIHEKEISNTLQRFPDLKKILSKLPRTIEIRGEVYMTKKSFEEINIQQKKRGLSLFANPRNIAAGSIRQLNPQIAASRKLNFLAYGITTDLGQKTHEEEHAIARMLGFKTAEPARISKSGQEIMKFWKEVLSKREKLPFLIDGVVVQVNERSIFSKIGVAGKAPRGALAFKFPGKETITTVENIIVQIGRTGVLTPVAKLRPTEVGGVMVSRATLHNLDEIRRLDVRVGDTVVIQRAGDVIPHIVRVLKNLRPRHTKIFNMPRAFCLQQVIRREGEVAHRIPHPEKCPLVIHEKIYHFVSRKAFDIDGLGPKIIDRLIEEALVTNAADLFRLGEGDIRPLERFAEKSAQNIIRAIQSKKEIELPKFIYALGILHVGEETAIDLANYFGSLEELKNVSLEDLKAVTNIGPVVAESIYHWFQNKQNQELIKNLATVGVKIKNPKLKIENPKLDGLSFVLTGGLRSMTRDEAKKRIRDLGGKISGSVSKKTSYVIIGSEPGPKLEKAKKLEVKIINEQEFLKTIG